MTRGVLRYRIKPGDRFVRLVAICRIDQPGPAFWICKCDCGDLAKRRAVSMIDGDVKSCGCLAAERKRIWAPAELSRIRDLYSQGLGAPEIAKQFGCDNSKIYDQLKRMGIKSRSLAEAMRLVGYRLDECFFDNIDAEAKAYWLGFVAADGGIASNRRILKVELQIRDKGHLQKLKQALDFDGPIREATDERKNNATLTLNSSRLVAGLLRQGIGPRKSLTLRPWIGQEQMMRHYWRGCIDGDGWIKHRVGVDYRAHVWAIGFCGTLAMVEAFRAFVDLHVPGAFVAKAIPKGKIWTVEFGGLESLQKVAELLYGGATVYLDRKKARIDEMMTCPILRHKKDCSAWTPELLLALKSEFGSWNAVARHLDIAATNLIAHRRRLGMDIRPQEPKAAQKHRQLYFDF